jgi:16S rRNA processing protein RimM
VAIAANQGKERPPLSIKLSSDQEKERRGSVDEAAEPRFLVIGQVRKPHGVRGEVRVTVHTELPERFTWLEQVYIGEVDPRPIAVTGVRFHQDTVLLKLAGIDNRDTAETLRGQWLQVPEAEAIPLEEGEYYLYQLERLEVYTDEGQLLGRLVQVIETGANNVFVVQGAAGEVLLPDTDEVIREIDFDSNRMTVHLMAGLLPD